MHTFIDDNTGEVLCTVYQDGTYSDLSDGWTLDDILKGYQDGWIVCH